MIKGLYTALVTPFNANGSLDTKGLRENIKLQVEAGVDGIVALGTTGEAPTLTSDEKNIILTIVKEEISGIIPFIVGTGSNSTETTIQNTFHAKKMGADCALIVAPYYNKPTQKGIYNHFKTIAETVDMPIILYNHPGRCGTNISIETTIELSKIKNIIGIKEVNSSQAGELIEKTTDFAIMAGDDPFTLPMMAMGGHGIISVTSNLMPQQMKNLVRSLQSQDYNTARKIYHELGPIFRAVGLETNPMGIKAAMKLTGMAAGSCRSPLSDMEPNNLQMLKTLIAPMLQETSI